MNPLISVIVPTCDRPDKLADCLERLKPGRQLLRSDSYEVIVSDDGGSDASREMMADRHSWAKWFKGPRRGPAANRNSGTRHAKGKWLAFCDDDCLPDADWLDGYRKAIAPTPGGDVYEGRTYADRPRRSMDEVAPLNLTGGFLWSCNFLIASELFREVGGFDERFPYAAMEDVDLRYRLQKRNIVATFVADAAVCHPWRQAGGWPQLRRQRESMNIYLEIHPEERRRFDSVFFFRALVVGVLRTTLPGILQYRGRGFAQSLLSHAMLVRMLSEALLRDARGALS